MCNIIIITTIITYYKKITIHMLYLLTSATPWLHASAIKKRDDKCVVTAFCILAVFREFVRIYMNFQIPNLRNYRLPTQTFNPYFIPFKIIL